MGRRKSFRYVSFDFPRFFFRLSTRDCLSHCHGIVEAPFGDSVSQVFAAIYDHFAGQSPFYSVSPQQDGQTDPPGSAHRNPPPSSIDGRFEMSCRGLGAASPTASRRGDLARLLIFVVFSASYAVGHQRLFRLITRFLSSRGHHGPARVYQGLLSFRRFHAWIFFGRRASSGQWLSARTFFRHYYRVSSSL